MENTAEWKEYAALGHKQRASKLDLVSKALVQAYVQMDKDLLLLEESGLMVSTTVYILIRCLCRLFMKTLDYAVPTTFTL